MRIIVTLCAMSFLSGCMQTKPWHLMVDADVETEAVNHSGDAADDPALWVNFANPEKSLIFGTQKKQGLYSYDLSGNIKQFLPAGRLNNVDVRQNYPLRGQRIDVAAASNRSDNSISLFFIEKSGEIKPWDVPMDPTDFSEVYGFCMGMAQQDLIFVVTGKNGDAELYQLSQDHSNHDELTLKKLRTLKIPTQSEGCVIDDANGNIFIGEEAVGVWQFNFWQDSVRDLVITIDGEKLVADVEGLALLKHSDKTYLVVSSQGNDQFPIYDLDNNSHVASIRVMANEQHDKVTGTDGIDVNQLVSTKQFPQGVFITQDDKNTKPRVNQNFKVVSLAKILPELKKVSH